MGCLTLPFKLAFMLLLLAALALGWLYRDHLVARVRTMLRPGASAPAPATGQPGRRALASAEAKIDSLNGWRADSVMLTADEAAALVRQSFAPAVRAQLDSIRVTLGQGEIDVAASLATARLPRELLGPLAMAVNPREPIRAGGPLRVTGPGAGEWEVRRLTVRDFPLPGAALPRLIGRAMGDTARRAVPLTIPTGVTGLRIRPGGITLYGAPRR
jgi:hypothetical protein